MFRYHPQYFGLFYVSGTGARRSIIAAIESSECKTSVYEATNSLLAILMGEAHSEVVTGLLSTLHELAPAISISLLAPAASKAAEPPRSNIYLDRIRVSASSPALIQSILDQDGVFALLDLKEGILWTLAPRQAGLFYDPGTASTSAIAQLAFTAAHAPGARSRDPSKPYDPIASRTSELISQTLPTVDESLADLSSKWQSRLHEPAPQEILDARSQLRLEVDLLKENVAESSPEMLMALISHGDSLAFKYTRVTSLLLSALDDYGVAGGDYRRHGSSLILNCARALTAEIADRLGLADTFRIFPYFDDSYLLYYPPVFRSCPGPAASEPILAPVGIPKAHKLRLGAIPITARLVGHLVDLKLSTNFLGQLINSRDTALSREGIGHMDREWSRLGHDAREWHALLARFADAVSVLACDLLACATMGPSYVYAVARFLSPISELGLESTSYLVRDGWQQGRPPLSERILLCLGYLKYRGLDANFTSVYFRERPPVEAVEFFEWIQSKVPRPFGVDEYREAIGQTKTDLMNGNVVSASPTIIVNALWDAVVRKTGYVNEMAALSSMGAMRSLGQLL